MFVNIVNKKKKWFSRLNEQLRVIVNCEKILIFHFRTSTNFKTGQEMGFFHQVCSFNKFIESLSDKFKTMVK